MRRSWFAYAVVGLLSVVTGLAIGGLPGDPPDGVSVDAPSIAAAPATSSTSTSTSTSTTSSTSTTTTTTTAPTTTSSTTSTTTTTTSTTTTAPPTTTTSTTTTVPPTTTTTTTTTTIPLLAPADLDVVVANGTIRGGVAARTADALREFGYEPLTTDAEIGTVSRVYYVEGRRPEAERLSEQLGIDRDPAPLESAPRIQGNLLGIDLVAYIAE